MPVLRNPAPAWSLLTAPRDRTPADWRGPANLPPPSGPSKSQDGPARPLVTVRRLRCARRVAACARLA